jgi:hypothetical protein
MTLKEAEKQCNKYKHLIGTMYKQEDKISMLVIVPTNPERFSDIILNVASGSPYKPLLIGFNDFDIIVMLNLESYPYEGTLFYLPLITVLNGLNLSSDL